LVVQVHAELARQKGSRFHQSGRAAGVWLYDDMQTLDVKFVVWHSPPGIRHAEHSRLAVAEFSRQVCSTPVQEIKTSRQASSLLASEARRVPIPARLLLLAIPILLFLARHQMYWTKHEHGV